MKDNIKEYNDFKAFKEWCKAHNVKEGRANVLKIYLGLQK